MNSARLELQIQQYLGDLQRQAAPVNTIRAYRADLAQLLAATTARAAEDLDAPALHRWLEDLWQRGLSRSSIRRKIAAVQSFLDFLQLSGVVRCNPIRAMSRPRGTIPVPHVPSKETVQTLLGRMRTEGLGRMPERDLALLELLYGGGLRVSEAAGLNVADVDLNARWLRVRGRAGQERWVPFGQVASRALVEYLPTRKPKTEAESALFLNHRGTRLTDRGARRIVKLCATWFAGDPQIHPHSFRHAYATHLVTDGADLRAVKELLGHASITTTQRYIHLSLERTLIAVYDRSHPKAF